MSISNTTAIDPFSTDNRYTRGSEVPRSTSSSTVQHSALNNVTEDGAACKHQETLDDSYEAGVIDARTRGHEKEMAEGGLYVRARVTIRVRVEF